jgi:putative endonuclease
MIKNDFEKLYVGITDNPDVRTKDHNTGRGAKFTKGRAKFKAVFLEEYATLAEVRKREIQIKKWRRAKKETLIERYRQGLPTHDHIQQTRADEMAFFSASISAETAGRQTF